MDFMEDIFHTQIEKLPEKEQLIAYKIQNFIFTGYSNWVKPILIALFMFFLFNKLKDALGWQEVIFIQLTVIIIFLRNLSPMLKKG